MGHTKRETLDDAMIIELDSLITANHAAVVPDTLLAPNWVIIEAMSPQLWVTRINGYAVGYCAHLVCQHVFTGDLQANCAAIYVMPHARHLTRLMIAQIERELTQQGVRTISYSVPHRSRAGSFFEAVGYECTELVMTKRVTALLA